MLPLVIVSLLWAFSFGLIRRYLTTLDSSAVALLRLLLSLLVFLPWLRLKHPPTTVRLRLMAIGAIEFGLMYLMYLEAFRDLRAYQVAVLTLLTPIFVCMFDSAFQRRFTVRPVVAALLSVSGAWVVMASHPLGHTEWRGILLVQASNACFAMGQLLYRRFQTRFREPQETILFFWLYLGAVLVTFPYAFETLPHTLQIMSSTQALVIAYLGLVASGVGFFLWNHGATRVKTAALAVMNNAKIPLGVLASVLVFGETTNYVRLTLGTLLVLVGLAIAQRANSPTTT
jgi:drug/metabolite transporter (DMT)-like permease